MSPEMSFAPVRPSGERGWSFSVIPKPRSGDYLTLLLEWFLRWYQSSGASHLPPSPLVLLWCCLILTIWNIFQSNSALKLPYSNDFQIFIIYPLPNDSPKESSYGTLKTAHQTYSLCRPRSLAGTSTCLSGDKNKFQCQWIDKPLAGGVGNFLEEVSVDLVTSQRGDFLQCVFLKALKG